MKLSIGNFVEDFSFSTPFNASIKLSDAMDGYPSVLYFLRYYGCTLCQLDMHTIAADSDRYKEQGLKVFVVLQSSPETIREERNEGSLPFTIICDEQQQLYKQFDIAPASSMQELGGGQTVEKVAQAKAAGFSHGKYEGEELQLPATFVLDSARKVIFSHYGTNGADIPSIDTVVSCVSLNRDM